MTPSAGSRALHVAGWSVEQLELDALHAPLRWVDPAAPEDELAWLPCHVLLCRRDDHAVLVDCGLGVLHDVFGLEIRTVPLEQALAAAGCAHGDVTDIVLTHLDPDHAGGVVAEGGDGALRPAFPDARVVLLDVALDLALGRLAERAEHAERLVQPLVAAGARVDGIRDGTEVAPGMRLRSAPGHRTGHACVELGDGRERFVFLADVLHARGHVEHPEWDDLHDSEPATALATRRALVHDLAGSGALVACSHVSGFGRIEREDGGAPRWVDVP